MTDVVLGYESGMDYEKNKWSGMGAIIGRNANRIGGYRFTLNGKEYILANNARGDNLHSGPDLYISRLWKAEPVTTELGDGIEFSLFSPHMDQGFPGNLNITVSYILTEDNSVIIEYSGMSDMDTIVNLTNHAYFNLEGEGSGTVQDHCLQIFSDEYTPFDDTLCSTGEILPVDGTPMDFRAMTRIGDRVNDPFFAHGRGIDNCWALMDWQQHIPSLRHVATLEAAERTMEVWTTAPGLQVYTGNWVEQNIGKSGKRYDIQHAICLETQHFPDSPNHANFPSPILRPGEVYYSRTDYRFV
jgi:aldose 1-epimerase